MSDAMLHAAFDHSRANGPAFSVLLALADFFNDSEGLARPSLDQLARKARVSRATAVRAVSLLVQLGEVHVSSNRMAGSVSHYRITLRDNRQRRHQGGSERATPPAQSEPPPRLSVSHGEAQREPWGGSERATGVAQREPQTDQGEQIIEQITEQTRNKPHGRSLDAHWRQSFGRNLNPAQRRMLAEFDEAASRVGMPDLIDRAITYTAQLGKDAGYLRGVIRGCIDRREYPGQQAAGRRTSRAAGRASHHVVPFDYDDTWAHEQNRIACERAGIPYPYPETGS